MRMWDLAKWYRPVAYVIVNYTSKMLILLLLEQATHGFTSAYIQTTCALGFDSHDVLCRYTHQLGDKQWEYKDWIAEQCGPDVAKTEHWRRKMYEATGQNKREFPDRYRDVWRDDDLVSQAKQAASKHSKELRAG